MSEVLFALIAGSALGIVLWCAAGNPVVAGVLGITLLIAIPALLAASIGLDRT